MSLLTALAIYFIIWWVTLFAVLPWGVKSAHESGVRVEPGHDDAAPVNPRLGVKFAVTSVIAGIIFLIVWWLITRSGLTLDDVPFMPQLRPS
jgi:predicted secreted protein